MISKRKAHHLLTILRRISILYLFATFLAGAIISAWALRSNYQTMAQLREQVYAADKANGDVASALSKLQAHVVRHMNTRLSDNTSVYPPIQLKYTYERLVAEEQARVDTINTKVYTQAQAHCEAQNSVDFSGRNRVPCIQQYVQDNGAKPNTIPASLYQFDFVAAKWSPDLAGWSLLVTALLGTLLLVRTVVVALLKRFTA